MESLKGLEKKKTQDACLFNLVVLIHDPQCIPYFNERVQAATARFPCNVISIIEKSARDEFVPSRSSEKGQEAIPCQHIPLRPEKEEMSQIPFVLFPFLIPDVPVNFLWSEAPPENDALFSKAMNVADRFIWDIQESIPLGPYARSLLQANAEGSFAISDLNWARITQWRDALACIFDQKQRLHGLKQAKRITVHFNANGGNSSCRLLHQSAFLLAWLAAQMNWKGDSFEEREEKTFFRLQRPGGSVVMEALPQHHEKFPPGSILHLEIQSEDGQIFALDRLEDREEICVHIEDASKCELPYNHPQSRIKWGHTLAEDLLCKGTSKHFLRTLDFLASIP